ncbi:MAG: NAD(P)/FAD-dependent oxidoreductase [Treponema sp.]|jgi:glycerol-3-phosphate dehydrogenase|nr:NAD(P)/FAD-dependent oxidoreductase [Treponema sp.]
MMSTADISKKLKKEFGGAFSVKEENRCLILEGQSDNWDDIVRAGTLAAHLRGMQVRPPKKNRRYDGIWPAGCIVNNIEFTGAALRSPRAPVLQDSSLAGLSPDVLVIGGGVTGCAIARELTRYDLDILLIEKEHDLALHASSRNDGMIHPGLDLKKSSWKNYYNSRGNALYDKITAELGVDFERPGQYLCFGGHWRPLLYLTLVYWKWLGIPGAQVLGAKELHRREPGLSKDIRCALYFPSAGIVCPYGLTIAYGENAVENGARLSLDTQALRIKADEGRITEVQTNRGTVYPKIVVNAAGVFAEDIADMAGDRFYSIHPRKGTDAILDKKFTAMVVKSIASRMWPPKNPAEIAAGAEAKKQSGHTKGGGVIKTIHGNLLIGPDAVETPEKENFATEAASIAATFSKFKNTSERLNESQIINYFSGIRAPTYEEDFVVCKGRNTVNLVHAAGIQSPGLTSAPAISIDAARFVVELLAAAGEPVKPNEKFNPVRKPIPHTAAMSNEERQALIKTNPDYGIILCRCEEVSKGEILDSLRRPVPCDTVDGVKRRVRSGGGRCQGGFCGPLVVQLIAAEKGIAPEAVLKSGFGSNVLCGETKAGKINNDTDGSISSGSEAQ